MPRNEKSPVRSVCKPRRRPERVHPVQRGAEQLAVDASNMWTD
jgi:hypothetical protein